MFPPTQLKWSTRRSAWFAVHLPMGNYDEHMVPMVLMEFEETVFVIRPKGLEFLMWTSEICLWEMLSFKDS